MLFYLWYGRFLNIVIYGSIRTANALMAKVGERDSRVRMSASKVMACRDACVGHSTADNHLKNDADFAAQQKNRQERTER
jgi:hypothetical protein